MLFVLVYSIVVEPFRMAFDAKPVGHMYVLETLVSIIFLLDIAFTFNTAYIENDQWVIDRRMIAMHYIKGRFTVELVGSYPAELIDILNNYYNLNGRSSSMMRAVRLLRLLRVLRVLRELRALFEETLITLESRLQANLAGLHLVGPLLLLVYVMHLLACAFVAIGNKALHDGYDESWMTKYDYAKAFEGTSSTKYLIALYWASGTSTGLGTGIVPANEYEYGFVSCAHVLGVVVMGSVIGWIARAIESSQSPIEKNIEHKLDIIKDITRWRQMPPELADHVIRFYAHYARRHAGFDENELLGPLGFAPTLRREVMKHFLSRSVLIIPMLSAIRLHRPGAEDDFKLEVDKLLRTTIHDPNDTIFSLHSAGSALLFLNDGTVTCSTQVRPPPASAPTHPRPRYDVPVTVACSTHISASEREPSLIPTTTPPHPPPKCRSRRPGASCTRSATRASSSESTASSVTRTRPASTGASGWPT